MTVSQQKNKVSEKGASFSNVYEDAMRPSWTLLLILPACSPASLLFFKKKLCLVPKPLEA